MSATQRLPAGRPDLYSKRRGDTVREATCAKCSARFLKYKTKKPARDYCSRACQFSHRTGALNPKWKGGTVRDLACKQCGQLFKLQIAAMTRNRGQYCSKACKFAANTLPGTPREKKRQYQRNRDLRERVARSIRHHTLSEWKALLARHGGRCVKCGSSDRIERDHIIPISKGGDDSIENIQPLCKRCNCSKHNKIEAT